MDYLIDRIGRQHFAVFLDGIPLYSKHTKETYEIYWLVECIKTMKYTDQWSVLRPHNQSTELTLLRLS